MTVQVFYSQKKYILGKIFTLYEQMNFLEATPSKFRKKAVLPFLMKWLLYCLFCAACGTKFFDEQGIILEEKMPFKNQA